MRKWGKPTFLFVYDLSFLQQKSGLGGVGNEK
jgi:hypothetical protein